MRLLRLWRVAFFPSVSLGLIAFGAASWFGWQMACVVVGALLWIDMSIGSICDEYRKPDRGSRVN